MQMIRIAPLKLPRFLVPEILTLNLFIYMIANK